MKFNFIALSIIILFSSLKAQTSQFIINGKISGSDINKLFIEYRNKKGVLITDSSLVQSGQFTFKGTINEPVQAVIKKNKLSKRISDPNLVELYLESGIMKLELNENKFKEGKLLGSQINNDAEKIKKKLVQIDKIIDAYKDSLRLLSNNNLIDVFEKKKKKKYYDSIILYKEKQVLNTKYKFILTNTDKYISAFILKDCNFYFSLDTLNLCFSKLKTNIKKSEPGLFVKDFLQKQYAVAVGKVAPDFNTKYSDGLFAKLTSICSKSKYVLIDFWASWCSPCRESFTNLKDYHERLNSKGFEIIAISLDNDNQNWVNAISKDKVEKFKHTLINLGSKDPLNEDISKKYTFNGIPFYLLLDEKCRVIAKTHDVKIILNKLDSVYSK